MKKLSKKRRELDVKIGLLHRQGRAKSKRIADDKKIANGFAVNAWVDRYRQEGLNLELSGNRLTIVLPEKLNFNSDLEITALNINAIRYLTQKRKVSHRAYRLGSVNFDHLKSISTSASLVLTAELSKWDDVIRNRLTPNIQNWDKDILVHFYDLGFFDLFKKKPIEIDKFKTDTGHSRRIVKYIKGRCGDDQKTRTLKTNITDMIGDQINKWMFLHGGLSEAIVNVSHHAYPKEYGFSDVEKNWYLTASFNTSEKELKVVFYDQGIGIPKSLPTSDLWEKTLEYLSIFPFVDRKKDETLLRAAVELDRTSTKESDRGKGLQDLLEFIRQRKNGCLSILSLKGLFELEVINGAESVRTDHFNNPVRGTLIIWSVFV